MILRNCFSLFIRAQTECCKQKNVSQKPCDTITLINTVRYNPTIQVTLDMCRTYSYYRLDFFQKKVWDVK